MFIKTKSGSTYEVDDGKKLVRRLCGVLDPTSRQGKDDEWKKYEIASFINQGELTFLLFDWTGQGNCTITSQIIEIINKDGIIVSNLSQHKINN